MTNEEIIERLKEVVNKPTGEITKEDKDFIYAIATEHGIHITNKRCVSCYIDAAVSLYRLLTDGEEEETHNVRYKLKAGVRVVFNGEDVNEDNTDDERAARLMRKGMPMMYFDVIYDEDED